MRVFVYEFVTGGGMLGLGREVPRSLLVEGSAMLAAAAEDFGLLAGAEVVVMRDVRLPAMELAGCKVERVESALEEEAIFRRLADESDAVLLIAPETGGELLRRCQIVETLGRNLLSPGSLCVALAGHKQATAERLAACGVRAPNGRVLAGVARPTRDDVFPLVAKPVDGCGSEGVQLIENAGELAALPADGTLRIEPFVRGMAASVAVLCGTAGWYALPTCQQRLSRDGRFSYLGGRLPLDSELAARARTLALAAVAALPEVRGYVGVDLVLGAAADGSEDYVIEINPRLTTSYLGLRAASRTNLAAAMVAVCRGERPNLSFEERPIEFDAAGFVSR